MMMCTGKFETTIEIKCSKCGRKLGVYHGEPFTFMDAIGEVQIICLKCWSKVGGE